MEISAIVFGKGRAGVEVFVDGKRIMKEKADLSGIHTVSAQAVGLAMGAHTLRAKATPERFETSVSGPSPTAPNCPIWR